MAEEKRWSACDSSRLASVFVRSANIRMTPGLSSKVIAVSMRRSLQQRGMCGDPSEREYPRLSVDAIVLRDEDHVEEHRDETESKFDGVAAHLRRSLSTGRGEARARVQLTLLLAFSASSKRTPR